MGNYRPGLCAALRPLCAGLEVTGVEVNRGWWESRYAPPTFLPLIFPDEERGQAAVEVRVSPSEGTALAR